MNRSFSRGKGSKWWEMMDWAAHESCSFGVLGWKEQICKDKKGARSLQNLEEPGNKLWVRWSLEASHSIQPRVRILSTKPPGICAVFLGCIHPFILTLIRIPQFYWPFLSQVLSDSTLQSSPKISLSPPKSHGSKPIHPENSIEFGVKTGLSHVWTPTEPGLWHDPHNNGTYSMLDGAQDTLDFQRITGNKKCLRGDVNGWMDGVGCVYMSRNKHTHTHAHIYI